MISRSKLSIIAALIVIFAGISLLFTAEEATAQDASEMSLYLHRSKVLNTLPPSSSDLPETPMVSGSEIVYVSSYPLTDDILLSGIEVEGNLMIVLHLVASEALLLTEEHELDVRVVVVEGSGSEIQVAGAIFRGTEMEADDLLLELTSPSGAEAPAGSTIELRISLKGPSGLGQAFSFAYLGTTNSSRLRFSARPFGPEDVDVSITNSEGQQLDQLLPNGPESARTFDISVSVRDAFGAYDISEVNILMVSETGSVIWNHTDAPGENGGQTFAYVNESHTIAEGTPEGTYDVRVTASSLTGQTASSVYEIVVASGLQVTVGDPDRDADAGETLEFRMDVLNGGEGTDRVTFSASSETGWNVEVPDPIEIDGGQTGLAVFRVFVPLRSSLGDDDVITLTAGSRNAERSYSRDVTVEVISAAVFGVEPVGETTKAVTAGGGVRFSIRVVNIQDDPDEFEMGMEDLPSGWTVSFSGDNGTMQGSIFVIQLPAEGETVVDLNMMTSSGSDGVESPRVFVRQRGTTERKYVYLKVRLVDTGRDLLTLVDTTDTKQSGRVGTNYPIVYSDVFFSYELYNPTLSEGTVMIDVVPPDGWTVEFDTGSLSLLPGELSLWNISVTPEEGEVYSEEPYETSVSVQAGALGSAEDTLFVELRKITSVEASPDRTSPDVVEGEDVLINVTMRNRGNHPVDLDLSVDETEGLTIILDPATASLEPGEQEIVKVTVGLVEVEEEGEVSFRLLYTGEDVEGSRELSVYGIQAEESNGNNYALYIVLAVIAAIIIVAGGYFAYGLFFGKGSSTPTKRKAPEPEKKGPPSSRVKKAPEARPIMAPRESERVKEADRLAADILAGEDRKELSGGVTVEAEDRKVLTAEELD